MAILNLVKEPDEFLYKKSRMVEEFDSMLHTFLDDMIATMKKLRGMGLAAVQVGRLMRICIVATDEHGLVEFINPEITKRGIPERDEEACLSIPGKFYEVMRDQEITVRYQDRNGAWQEKSFSGLDAVCIQHEMDHMDGITLTTNETAWEVR
ncbi:MAG: peptide deformylase [Firmicutes bacterium]|nr:peptide deformylase [Bacillota bacterium]